MSLKYYHNLDGVRGIAALMVVIFHYFTYPNSNFLSDIVVYQKLTEFGQHGVSWFFVLSGFVITRILINTRGYNSYFWQFYRNRVLRILPLYYLFLFIYYNYSFLIDASKTVSFDLQLPYYLYIQNIASLLKIPSSGPGHFWTLAVEEHFYLLWPLVVFLVAPKYLGKVIFVGIAAVFVVKYFMLSNGLSINYFTFTRIDQIMMGGYLAFLEWRGEFDDFNKNHLYKLIYLVLFVFSVSVTLYVLGDQPYVHFVKEMMKYFLLGIFFTCITGFLIVMKGDSFINRLMLHRSLQYLGKISYGVYVWHVLVLIVLNKLLLFNNLLVDLFLVISVTLIVSHISYFYFESFFLKFKKSCISL